VKHSYGTSAVVLERLLAKDGQKPELLFQGCTIFSCSLSAKFHVQTSGWMEVSKQVLKHFMIID
jgi:hypothetical protein